MILAGWTGVNISCKIFVWLSGCQVFFVIEAFNQDRGIRPFKIESLLKNFFINFHRVINKCLGVAFMGHIQKTLCNRSIALNYTFRCTFHNYNYPERMKKSNLGNLKHFKHVWLTFKDLFFENVGPPKEDIFFDHLLWSVFQSSSHIFFFMYLCIY